MDIPSAIIHPYTAVADVAKSITGGDSGVIGALTGGGQNERLDVLNEQQSYLRGLVGDYLTKFNEAGDTAQQTEISKSISPILGIGPNTDPNQTFVAQSQRNIDEFKNAALEDLNASQTGVETARLRKAKTTAIATLAPLGLQDDTQAIKAVSEGLANVSAEVEALFAPQRTAVRQTALAANQEVMTQDLAFRLQFLSMLQTVGLRSQGNIAGLVSALTGQESDVAELLGQAATPGEQALSTLLGIGQIGATSVGVLGLAG